MTSDGAIARFFSLEEATPLKPFAGVSLRALYGEGASISLVRLGPGAVLPVHEHPHEQLGLVLEGTQILLLDGREYPIEPMQGYVVPGGVEHGGRGGPKGCRVLDIFVPVREEYRAAAAPEVTIQPLDPQ